MPGARCFWKAVEIPRCVTTSRDLSILFEPLVYMTARTLGFNSSFCISLLN